MSSGSNPSAEQRLEELLRDIVTRLDAMGGGVSGSGGPAGSSGQINLLPRDILDRIRTLIDSIQRNFNQTSASNTGTNSNATNGLLQHIINILFSIQTMVSNFTFGLTGSVNLGPTNSLLQQISTGVDTAANHLAELVAAMHLQADGFSGGRGGGGSDINQFTGGPGGTFGPHPARRKKPRPSFMRRMMGGAARKMGFSGRTVARIMRPQSLPRVGGRGWRNIGGGIGAGAATAGKGAADLLQSQRFGDIGASVGRITTGLGQSIAALGTASAGPIGVAVAAIGVLGSVAAQSVQRLKDWGDQLHNANLQFAEFSAAMTEVQVMQEIRDMFLSRERGDRRAESAGKLAEAKHRLNEQTSVLEDKWANLKADILVPFLDLATTGVTYINDILKWLEKWGLIRSKEEDDKINSKEWLDAMGLEKWFEKHGRPRRFQR